MLTLRRARGDEGGAVAAGTAIVGKGAEKVKLTRDTLEPGVRRPQQSLVFRAPRLGGSRSFSRRCVAP